MSQTLNASTLLAVPLAPLVGSALAGIFGTQFGGNWIGRRLTHTLTILGVLIAFILSATTLKSVAIDGARLNETRYTWMTVGDLKMEIGFLVDGLSAMMMFDTNIVVDLREADGTWLAWSERAVAIARLKGPVSVSAVVLGELASGSGMLTEILALLDRFGLAVAPLSVDAAFQAGLAHPAYRLAGGRRQRLLADFLIGGHPLSV